MSKQIKKAVFPVAGLGTRFLPATKASPKEMLTIVDKPLIQYAVEEAYEAGIREMIFVTGKNKRTIEDHFDTAHELEAALNAEEKHELIAAIDAIKPKDMTCIYIRQAKALGLGHAVLCAEPLIQKEPFAVLLVDDLMQARPSVLKQMVDLYSEHQCSLLAIQEVPLEETRRYGIVQGSCKQKDLIAVNTLVEKPEPALAPSTMAIVGRYILSANIFEFLKKQSKGFGNEIQLTDAIANLLSSEKVLAYRYQGQRYDCGNKLGFLQANVDFALQHPEVSSIFTQWLKCKNSF